MNTFWYGDKRGFTWETWMSCVLKLDGVLVLLSEDILVGFLSVDAFRYLVRVVFSRGSYGF
jgi:hypothetical protein